MKKYDFHNYTEAEVLSKTLLIFQTAIDEEWDSVEIVVGKSGRVVHNTVVDLCNENGYEWTYDKNNVGAVIIYFD